MMIYVIIPVFNSEAYIKKCFDSILAQSFDNWQVIAVDDGSTDSSYELMKKYQQIDNRFRIYHQGNKGAGAARNYALQVCKADLQDGYVVFLDSDDYIEADYFQILSSHREDVVFIDVEQKDINGKIVKTEKMSIYSEYEIDDILRKQMTGCIPWGGCRKAYNARIIFENNIQYSTHTVGEEAVFSFKALHYAQNVGFIEKPVYSYVLHEGSLSSVRIDDPWGEVADNLKKEIIQLDIYEIYADTINAFYVSAAAVSLRRLAKNYGFKEYREKAHARIDKMYSCIDSEYEIDTNSLRSAAKLILLLINTKLLNVVYVLGRVF